MRIIYPMQQEWANSTKFWESFSSLIEAGCFVQRVCLFTANKNMTVGDLLAVLNEDLCFQKDDMSLLTHLIDSIHSHNAGCLPFHAGVRGNYNYFCSTSHVGVWVGYASMAQSLGMQTVGMCLCMYATAPKAQWAYNGEWATYLVAASGCYGAQLVAGNTYTFKPWQNSARFQGM